MTSAVPVVLERENVNDETVTLVRWFVQQGEKVELDALLAEVETSKANVEVRSPAAGYVVREFSEGAEIPASATIAHISAQPVSAELPKENGTVRIASVRSAGTLAGNGAIPTAQRPQPQQISVPEFPSSAVKQRISPVAARMMEEHGIAAEVFAGKSVVRKQDVVDFLNPAPPAPITTASPASGPRFIPSPVTLPTKAVPLSKMKRSERAGLGAGTENAISSSVTTTCFTKGFRRIVESKLDGGTAAAVMVYEVSRLLRKYPTLNATYCDGAMLQYENVNVGFAMDDGRGLKVAVIRDCDTLSLQAVTDALRELTVAYLQDKLTPALIAGATFTVSDLSGLGVSSFQPLISENQGAILGIGGEQFAPDNSFGFYTLTLTFDHQLSNGRIAASFLSDLKARLDAYETAEQAAAPKLACSRCFRSIAELRETNQYLIRSVEPDGYLCSSCLAGW